MTYSERNEKAIKSLDPLFQVIVRRIIRDYDGEFLITDGYRSFSAQDALYRKGRTTAGQIVTNAKAGYSLHNYGYAIDVVPIRGGEPNYTDIESFMEIAKIAKKHGCEWGGDWKERDMPHIQYTQGLTITDIRNGMTLKESLVPSDGSSWIFGSLSLEKMVILTRKALTRSQGLRESALKRKLERLLSKMS